MRPNTIPSKIRETRPDRNCPSPGNPWAWVSFKDATRLLGHDPYRWSDEGLRAVLRQYEVNCQPNVAKTILVHELCLLVGRLKEDADKIPTRHRSRILRVAGVGPRRPFIHLLTEVLRYHVNSGNLDKGAEDYPYVVNLPHIKAGDIVASTPMIEAIREDYQRAYQHYDDGTILDLGDEQAFARLLNEGPNPRVTYTQRAFDLWAYRFVRSLEDSDCDEQQMEMDEHSNVSSQLINQDLLMSDDSGTTHDKGFENEQLHSCSNSVTNISDEAENSDSDYNPDVESISVLKRVTRMRTADAASTVEEAPEFNDTEDHTKPADYDTDTDSVIARTSGRYGTIGKGRCPNCSKSHTIVREQHHARTFCKQTGS